MGISTGLVVTAVEPSSRASDAGLREGDVIEEVDGAKVTTADALRSGLSKAAGTPALLLVHRGEATFYLTVERNS